MTALVTGATGFVGSAVARALLARGEAVRVIARRGSDRSNLNGLEVEVVEGDYTDFGTQKAACQGISSLYHVAADYRLWIPDPEVMMRTNVDGSVALVRAAADAGAQRIVYTSSVAALGIPKDGTPGTEATPVTINDMVGTYKRSKFLAEQAVRAIGAPVVTVNPSTPIGPRDVKPTPTGRVILEAAKGKIPAFVDTGLNVAHVDDVAAGHLLAHDKGQVGARYILGGDDLTLEQILAHVAQIKGRKPPKIKLTPELVMPIAWVSELAARVTGKEPMATIDSVRMSRKRMFFSSAKARAELGYTARPAAEAIRDAVAWFAANGRLTG
jgi:dihydroflavonol-4-reductase